jgi:glycerophosphoryl diester phosphodiesterase
MTINISPNAMGIKGISLDREDGNIAFLSKCAIQDTRWSHGFGLRSSREGLRGKVRRLTITRDTGLREAENRMQKSLTGFWLPSRCNGTVIKCIAVISLGVLAGGCEPKFSPVGADPFQCAESSWEEARIDPRRFIAHAGGGIDGRTYTNSLDAINQAYDKGFRLIELDLIETRDGQLVAAHDWEVWRQATGSDASAPSRDEFRSLLLFGRYRTMDLEDLEQWFAARPDAFLVTDKVTEFEALIKGFQHVDKMIVEVFSVADYERARREGIRYPMLSLHAALLNDEEDEVLALLRREPVKFLAVASKIVRRQEKLLKALRRNGACIYVFTSSDSRYLESVFDGPIYGAYTDEWNLELGRCGADACETY